MNPIWNRSRRLASLLGALLTLSLCAGAAPQVPGAKSPRQGAPSARKAASLKLSGTLDFGAVEVGAGSDLQAVTITNTGTTSVTLDTLAIQGADAASFTLVGAPGLPLVLAGGQALDVDVQFQPLAKGAAGAGFAVGYSPAQGPPVGTGVFGLGLGAPGQEVRLNAGGYDYVDLGAVDWTEDFAHVGGVAMYLIGPVQGTTDPILYRDQRQGPSFRYEFPLPNGPYAVTLRFAEMQVPFPGGRRFDVVAEGLVALDDFDIVAAAGFGSAHSETFEVELGDGLLELEFLGVTNSATVSTIEVSGLPRLAADTTDAQFGAVASGGSAQLPVLLTNTGTAPLTIDTLEFLLGPAGTPASMSADLFGSTFDGEQGAVSYPVGQGLAPGASTPLDLTFAPTSDQYDQCLLRLSGDFGQLDLTLTGLGGHEGHPYLHPVIETEATLIDYDGNGVEDAFLDGSLSHTHEPGKSLVGYAWSEGGGALASGPVVTVPLALGTHTVQLLINDDNVPSESLATTVDVDVLSSAEVPGVLVTYHDAKQSAQTPAQMMTSPPATADYAEVVDGMLVEGLTTIGTSPYTQDLMVRLQATLELPTAMTLELQASGGAQRLVLLNGLGVVGPVAMPAGRHTLDARFAVDAAGQTPLVVLLGIDGGTVEPIDEAWLDHDESGLVPLITSMPAIGTSLGGNQITIEGLGFFPAGSVTVHWGGTSLSGQSLDSVAAGEVVLTSPPGSGVIQVTVETPNGTSNAVTFTYDPSGPVPINFNALPDVSVHDPTAGAWGPDGRFYVGSLDGELHAIQFDDNYGVVSTSTYPGVSNLSNFNVLGVTTNPWDPPSPVRIYVSHGTHFVNGGSSFVGPSPYTGQISILEGPNFDTPIPLITQLPTSNHDHAVNGLVFDNNGDLLISVGSNTNAGVKHPNSGDLVESPLSAAIIKARTSKPGFNGAIEYLLTASGMPSTDQVDGEVVDVAPGVDVEVFAHGLRNAYDLVYTMNGRVYATDNGPNPGFGAASTSATTEVADPYHKDEVNLIEYDGYYGSPNRARGRYDERQNVYRNASEPGIPGEFTQTMVILNSSIDGIDEYRANTFQGQLRGDLVAQKMGSYAYRLELGPNGNTIAKTSQLTTWSGALGVEMMPGGAICAIGQGLNYLRIFVPDDLSAVGVQVHDVTPWRGPETGGTPFVIGGVGFVPGTTQVFFDGVAATLTSVSATRIRGVTPAHPGHPGELIDVEVKVGGSSVFLADGFRYLYPPGNEPGRWENLPNGPTFLGEVAAGVIGKILYVVGSGGGGTYRYDLGAGAWLSNAPNRPFKGDHHALEVVDGKLYVFGGLEGGAEGKVQIFDPVANQWSLGTDMPWAAGSVSTALLNGVVHVAGGIVGTSTVANHATYDPQFDAWTTLAPMPLGRNHAAATSDGERFYVIGGRDGQNLVTNGFNDVQIFDPQAGTWTWSADGVSGIAPLPQARGGMGTAVWFQNEIYVFGGETLNGAGAVAGNVYDRVDVYDPATNTWRLDAPMPHPRHGIYPAVFGSRIYLACGGTSAGTSGSKLLDAFSRP